MELYSSEIQMFKDLLSVKETRYVIFEDLAASDSKCNVDVIFHVESGS